MKDEQEHRHEKPCHDLGTKRKMFELNLKLKENLTEKNILASILSYNFS